MSLEPPPTLPTDPNLPLGDEEQLPTQIPAETDTGTSETTSLAESKSSPSSIFGSSTPSLASTSLSSTAPSSSSFISSSTASSSRKSSSRIFYISSRSTSRPTSTPTSVVAAASSSGGKRPSPALPIVLSLLGLVLVAGLGLWWLCLRRRRRNDSRRRMSGIGGWKGLGTREVYRDDPAPVGGGEEGRGAGDVEMRAVVEEAESTRSSRRGPRDRSSLDTVSSDPYLLSDISHISTFNPTLEIPQPSHSSHGASRPSHHPPSSPESPTPPSRSVSFSFLRKSASPLTGLVASLFPSGYGAPSLRTVVSSSNEADDGVSRASSVTKRSIPTQRTFITGMESSVGLLEEGKETMEEDGRGQGETGSILKLSEVRKGRREISSERTRPEAVRREGMRGEIHDVV